MPKYSFTILGKPFCSKKAITSRCRLIRDNYEYGQFLNVSDTAFILECVNVFCPKDKSYLINNIAKIFVDKAPQKLENGYLYHKDTKCFYAILKGNEMKDDFGLFQWIDKYNRDTRMCDIHEAARNAIKNTVLSVIKDIKFPYKSEMPNSNVVIQSRDDAHVDHYDKDFSEVLADWIEQKGGIDVVYKKVKPTEPNSSDCEFIEDSTKNDFDSFCSQNSHLRIISKKENLTRPKVKIKR